MDGTYVAPELLTAPWSRRIRDAVRNGISETVEISGAIVLMVGYMVGGQVDSSNLGGPIMMFDAASRAAEAGWLSLVRMAGLLSVNLGILNLVPVPGLDGGQLLLLTFEGIRRRPLSMRARQIAGFVGIVSIVLLMLFAFKNDIERYWVDVATWLNA
jgi:regulator of sigma E protease